MSLRAAVGLRCSGQPHLVPPSVHPALHLGDPFELRSGALVLPWSTPSVCLSPEWSLVSSSACCCFWRGSLDIHSPRWAGLPCSGCVGWRQLVGVQPGTLGSRSSPFTELSCFWCSVQGVSLQSLQNFAVVYRELRKAGELRRYCDLEK